MTPIEWLQSQNWLSIGSSFLQLSILVLIIYFLYHRFIRKSHAEQLLKGLFVVLLLFIGLWRLASFFNMGLLEVIFGASIQLLIIGLIVIFQPELRRTLIYLGQPELIGRQVFADSSQEEKAIQLVHDLTEAIRFLSKSKTGALIVLETSPATTGNYLEEGTAIDARLSTELLLTIFHPNTPLHDGAVVINSDNRIVAAGVLLPLTEDPKLSWQFGTRHRAAIGLTETSDSVCIVVSEETGLISMVSQGALEKMAGADELKKRLERLYHVQSAKSEKRRQGSLLGERFTDLFYNSDFLAEAIPTRLQQIFNWRKPDVSTIGKNNEVSIRQTAPKPSSGKPSGSSSGASGV